jgi:hypothetical protein
VVDLRTRTVHLVTPEAAVAGRQAEDRYLALCGVTCRCDWPMVNRSSLPGYPPDLSRSARRAPKVPPGDPPSEADELGGGPYSTSARRAFTGRRLCARATPITRNTTATARNNHLKWIIKPTMYKKPMKLSTSPIPGRLILERA